MKTKFTIILAAIIAVSTVTLTACQDIDENTNDSSTVTTDTAAADSGSTASTDSGTSPDISVSPSADGYTFEYSGYEVVLGSLAEDLLAALGTPSPENIFEEVSCAFHGIDYVYTYDGVQFNTFSPGEGEKDRILAVVFLNDIVTTKEGVYLGMTPEQVRDVYGEPDEVTEVRTKYLRDGMSLNFIFNGDALDDITYTFDNADEFKIEQ
ncbi:MAG: hypothetical protein FWF82_03745 [Oscillospiraceae bacterium]|nr:hypothetical protein [Oscillospiraceae bacterium]